MHIQSGPMIFFLAARFIVFFFAGRGFAGQGRNSTLTPEGGRWLLGAIAVRAGDLATAERRIGIALCTT
jgi:hypothetical protein